MKRYLKFSLLGLLALVSASAAVMAIARHYYVPPLDKIAGLETQTKNNEIREVRFEKSLSRQTVRHLVANLRSGSSLRMFDSTYYSASDPGAFVNVVSLDGKFYCEFFNHGWSGYWFEISRDDLEAYLWVCRRDNMADASESYTDGLMSIGSNSKVLMDSKIELAKDSSHAKFVRERISMDRVNVKKN